MFRAPLTDGPSSFDFRGEAPTTPCRAVYRFVQSNGDSLALCDECGFQGGLFDASEAGARFRELPTDWRQLTR